MSDLKCPFCPEVRPSRSRLQTHVEAHHYTHKSAELRNAVAAARSIEDVPAPALLNITETHERADDTIERLEQAGRDIADLKAQAKAVEDRMNALDNLKNHPAEVRRQTLKEVWGLLTDTGQHQAALIVMSLRATTTYTEGNETS